jgi:Ca-activated chloride channel family protein
MVTTARRAVHGAPLACAAALAVMAFRPGAAQQPTFRTGVRTVPVYATVSDGEGRLVPNLEKDQFRVFDNGRPVNLTVFSNQAQPITVAVMLDMSGSMGVRLTRVVQSADRFIDAIAPGDRARLGSFGWEVSISPVLTDDKARLRRVLNEELWPGGPTPLWRALLAAMTSLEHEGGRRVVLVLTDGDDNDEYKASRPKAADVRRRAVRDAFMLYAIGMERSQRTVQFSYTDQRGADVRGERPSGLALGGLSDEVVDLVEETGGGHFVLPTGADLGQTFARVAEELRHQYLLGFSPDTLDGKTHTLDVRVNMPGCVVRARRSYAAEGER